MLEYGVLELVNNFLYNSLDRTFSEGVRLLME